MTVADLIKFLKKQPQDLPVARGLYSEQCLLVAEDIEVVELGLPRDDGWVHAKRSDRPSQKYLLFIGN